MGLAFWWLFIAWLVAVTAYWVIRYILLHYWRFNQKRPTKVPIAHSDRLTNLPEYQQALQRYKLFVRLATASATIALLTTMIVSARPQHDSIISSTENGRDVMLCLDVSGSMLRVDAGLVDSFHTLVDHFPGQRFGLTIFNSSAVSVIPLSDDYSFIDSKLQDVSTALRKQSGAAFTSLTNSTLVNYTAGTSLVGDGVATCINNFGLNPLGRSQSVILATDNHVVGTPIVSEPQATALAQKHNVRIYAIDPTSGSSVVPTAKAALQKMTGETAGAYETIANTTLESIINSISLQDAKYSTGAPVEAITDRPSAFFYITVITVLATVYLLWRLKL